MIIKKHSTTFFQRILSRVRNSKTTLLLGVIGIIIFLFTIINLQPTITITPDRTFYTTPTEITLSTTSLIPYELRYTLDGTTPTATSTLYEGPLTINETTVIRVSAFHKHTAVSPAFTFPVFINTDHELPVVSITTSPTNLWGEEAGIYSNYEEKGDDWERPAHLSFYEPDGTLGFQKNVGVRLHGGGSRSYPQKSFRIYAGYQDHEDQIKYPLFPELEYQNFNTFLLRPASGDWEFAFMRDAVMHDLARNVSDIDNMAVRPAVVYLNNQYWGIYYLRERIDQHYFANKYGLSRNRLSIVEVPHDVGEDRGKVILDYGHEQAVKDYNQLFESAQRCTGCAHYNDFSSELDIANFIDYMLLELYSGNFDWPYGNVKLWRYEQAIDASGFTENIIDGRFRWILYDLDVGLGFQNETEEEMIRAARGDIYGRHIDDKFPFRNLFFDEKFKQEYLTRTTELLNTKMSTDAVLAVINNRADSIRAEIPAQVDRWSGHTSPHDNKLFTSSKEWERYVSLLKTYVTHRADAFFEQTAKFYDLSGLSHITLNSSPANGGGISIGAIKKESAELPWQGTFFNESYMAVEAHPHAGYVFDHWEGDIPVAKRYNQRVVIKIENQENITAVFRKKHWFEYVILGSW